MNKIQALLLIDLDETCTENKEYLSEEVLASDSCKMVGADLFKRCVEVRNYLEYFLSSELNVEVHYTGQSVPLFMFRKYIHVTIPYWAENIPFLQKFYSRYDSVLLGGMFTERCIHNINCLLPNSELETNLCISQEMVGDYSGEKVLYSWVETHVKKMNRFGNRHRTDKQD